MGAIALMAITVDEGAMAWLCRRHHIRWLAVFGSILQDDFGPERDVDMHSSIVSKRSVRRRSTYRPKAARRCLGFQGIASSACGIGSSTMT